MGEFLLLEVVFYGLLCLWGVSLRGVSKEAGCLFLGSFFGGDRFHGGDLGRHDIPSFFISEDLLLVEYLIEKSIFLIGELLVLWFMLFESLLEHV